MTVDATSPVLSGDPASLAQAQAYQARRMTYMQHGDVGGLVRDLYTPDARLHAFDFRAEGGQAIQSLIELMQQRLAGLGAVHVEQLIAGRDFIWQELTIDSPAGRIEPYEFKFLRDGRVYLQLYGFKQGNLWQPGDLARFTSPAKSAAAAQWHHRYIDYQARQDADGLADDFFTAEGRLVTLKNSITGRAALRSFFQHKFQAENGFHLVSTRNITGADDYAWFEATAGGSQGIRTVYDVMLLQDGRVSLQLVGTLEGTLPINRSGKPETTTAA
jgi:hypothetical protein